MEQITVEALITTEGLRPEVGVNWGGRLGILSPGAARDHGMRLISEAIAAEIEAAVMQWMVGKLELSTTHGQALINEMRSRERENRIPSCSLTLDGESVTPDEARAMAASLLFNAFNAELEALLALALMEKLGIPIAVVEQLIQEFREMRGLVTDWAAAGEADD